MEPTELLEPNEQAEMRQYLYDLQGYLVIEDVLTAVEVSELNAAIDAQIEPIPEDWQVRAQREPRNMYQIYRYGMAGGSYDSGPGFLDWGPAFTRLIDHPAVMEVMRLQLGERFRLDRIFGMRMVNGMPSGMLHSDYGASAPFTEAIRGQHYAQPAHQALHGFGVAVFNLTDSGPDTGGLRVIPGSHHSHFKLPKKIRSDELTDIVVCPQAPAGSVTLFSEATTHGTCAWTAGHERRSLLYKYCTSNLTWSRTRVTAPQGVALSARQRRLLQEPGGGGWFFPSVFDEGAAAESD